MEVVPCIVIIPIQLYGSGTVYSGTVYSHIPIQLHIPRQLYGSGTVYSHYTDTVVWKWYRV